MEGIMEAEINLATLHRFGHPLKGSLKFQQFLSRWDTVIQLLKNLANYINMNLDWKFS